MNYLGVYLGLASMGFNNPYSDAYENLEYEYNNRGERRTPRKMKLQEKVITSKATKRTNGKRKTQRGKR